MSANTTFSQQFLAEAAEIITRLDIASTEKAATMLAATRAAGGRLFILGVGGSAANASHAVNDFRKIAGIEAYAPTDNVAELTARTNDEGWATVFDAWLRTSRLRAGDLVPVSYTHLDVYKRQARMSCPYSSANGTLRRDEPRRFFEPSR